MKLFDFDNSYARLPELFYKRWLLVPVNKPRLFAFNKELAIELGIHYENFDNPSLASVFAGNMLPSAADPIAQAYAGHQFGHFVPQLGDGRAVLLGEVIDRQGIRRDIQLKGAGRTPFSRTADGRAALGPVIREYIVSEAMHKLGIPTTRSLAAVTTGEPVYRETALPGAILTRVAASHIRIGTFEYFASRREWKSVRILADHVIERHYPDASNADNPYAALLEGVVEAQASLIASWMQVGFIHGVMNTDNMTVSGETIDYGPCAFMDQYDPMMVFSSIDRNGRYAFDNQARVALWNLSRLAETLLGLIDTDVKKAVSIAEEILNNFLPSFKHHWLTGMRRKLGLFTQEEDDITLIESLLDLMHKSAADYTLTFRSLSDLAENKPEPFRQLFTMPDNLDEWIVRWLARLKRQPQSMQDCANGMRKINPMYIPRNHRIEQTIISAIERSDFSSMERLIEALSTPYTEQQKFADFALSPHPSERVEQTFCGT